MNKIEKRNKEKNFIPLRTDLTDISLSQNLRKYKIQNYHEMLNSQKKKKGFSFKSSFLHLSKSHVIDNNKIDFNKFPSDSISINPLSPRQIHEEMTLKDLLDQDYINYIKTIKKTYPNFKFNHYSKYFEKVKNKREVKNEITSYRNIHLKKVNKCFMVSSDGFKVNQELLEKSKAELSKKTIELDSQVEEIDIEMDKILKESNKIEEYFFANVMLQEKLEKVLSKIISKKSKKEEFKRRIIDNNLKIFVLNHKRNNAREALSKLKMLNNIHTQFQKILSGDIKIAEENKIALKMKKELNELKFQNRNLKILSLIEREMLGLNEQNETKYIKEFGKITKKIFEQCFTEHSSAEVSADYHIENQKKYDLSSVETFDNSEKSLLFPLSTFPFSTKSDVLNLLDLFGMIIQESYDIHLIIEELKQINQEIIKKIFLKSSNKEDGLNILSETYATFVYNYNYIVNLFQNNFASSPKMFQDLKKFIVAETKSKITLVTDPIMAKIVLNNLNPDSFIQAKQKIFSSTTSYFNSIKFSQNDFFVPYESDFLFQFFDSNHEEVENVIETEEWVQFNQIPFYFQKIIDILSVDYKEQKKEIFDINFLEQNNPVDLLKVNGNSYKIIQSTLKIIMFIYNTYKILFFFNNKEHNQTIINKMCKTITMFIINCKDEIIDGNGKIPVNQRAITEKDIILLNSTICILQEIIFTLNTFFICDNDEVLTNSLNKLITNLNQIHSLCQNGIMHVLEQLSNEVFEEANEMDFKNYPVLQGKEHNNYVKKFVTQKKIYDSMINCFGPNDIKEMFKAVLDNLFDNFYSIIVNKGRLEPDKMLKQFRGEMKYLKKLIKTYDLLDVNGYIEKIEDLSKMVNPFKIPKKKVKKTEEKEDQ